MPSSPPATPRPAARRRAQGAARPSGRQPGNARPPRSRAASRADPRVCIDDVVADLAKKQSRLSAILDSTDPEDLTTFTKLFALHAQIASRMGRLLRDQRALSGAAADGIAGAIAQALDELSSELGTPL
jgi:hypothetical protein